MSSNPYEGDEAASNRLINTIRELVKLLEEYKKRTEGSSKAMEDFAKMYYKSIESMVIMNKKHDQVFAQMERQIILTMAKDRARQTRQTDEVHERYRDYFEMQREMVDYRHSFADFDTALGLSTKALFGGLGIAGIFEGIMRGGRGVIQQQEKTTSAQRNFQEIFERDRLAGESEEEFRERSPKGGRAYDKYTSARDSIMGQMGQQKIGGKTLATRLEGIASFLKKHKVGVLIALGSLVILGAIVRKALDSSPMFQQMLKLWQFAITMIFRPLGDFFGFFFRPILILLLRKFIIPWYTTMYPVMIKLGHDLGSFVAGAMDWFLKIGTWFGSLFGDMKNFNINDFMFKLIGGATGYARDIIGYFTNDFFPQVFAGLSFGSTILDFFTNSILPAAFAEDSKTVGGLWDNFMSMVKNILTNFPTIFSSIISSIEKNLPSLDQFVSWFVAQLPDFQHVWDTLFDQFENYLGKGGEFDQIFAQGKEQFEKFFGKGGHIDQLMDPIKSIVLNMSAFSSYLATEVLPLMIWAINIFKKFRANPWGFVFDQINPFAEGGRITEPILGIGRSGQAYSFGEKGSETVIPDGKMGSFGGSITINIENMSGSQQDLNNLRQTILSVMQESRTRGGRI